MAQGEGPIGCVCVLISACIPHIIMNQDCEDNKMVAASFVSSVESSPQSASPRPVVTLPSEGATGHQHGPLPGRARARPGLLTVVTQNCGLPAVKIFALRGGCRWRGAAGRAAAASTSPLSTSQDGAAAAAGTSPAAPDPRQLAASVASLMTRPRSRYRT